LWAEKSIQAVCHALDLLDFAVVDYAELYYAAVGRREESIVVGIERSYSRLESAVEERCKVRVNMKIRLRYFVKTVRISKMHFREEAKISLDTEYPAI